MPPRMQPRGGNRRTPAQRAAALARERERREAAQREEEARLRTHKIMNVLKMVEEKGIDLRLLRDTAIPTVIEERGWQSLAAVHRPANLQLVREFYANMNPDQFLRDGRVVVRNQEVVITKQAINEYFNLQHDPSTRAGFSEYLEDLSMEDLAGDLRMDGDRTYIPGVRDIAQGELDALSAFWNIFISYTIAPLTRRHTLTEDRARTVYAIKNGLPLNVGGLMFMAIHCSDSDLESLCLPNLITHFCSIHNIQSRAKVRN